MIFALSFLWVYYSLKSVMWAAALALTLAICSAYLIWRIQNKLGQVKSVKLQNKKAVANLYDFLKYNDDNAAVFAELYRYYHYTVTIIDFDSFLASKDNSATYVSLLYASDNLKPADVARTIVTAKRLKADKARIFVAKVDPTLAKTAAQHFDAQFVDISNAYMLLEQSGKLPCIPQSKPTKSSFVAKYAFSRKRFGWYFGASIFMAIASLVAYFPYYTLAWATVMLALALYSLFNTRFNARQTNVTLD